MRRLLSWFGVFLLLSAAGLVGWNGVPGLWRIRPTPASEQEEGTIPTPGVPWFEDVTEKSGIDFAHFDSATTMHYIQELMGSGVAWIDYDGDGWLDLFFVQDGPIRPSAHTGPLPTHKLYRNNGDGTFTDVTKKVGLNQTGYGMGCAVGDFDNDGFDDLFVTYLGGVKLFHNQPDGKGGRRFVDVTARSGLHNPHWATSCAWGDIDGDGLLDLYVCNYVELDLDHYKPCSDARTGIRHACPPTVFTNTTHRLYRNNGDGTFTDISGSSGVATAAPSPGLGVAMVDLDGDGKIDIFACNDLKPTYLFHNQGGGRFMEKAIPSGCGLDANGRYIAGMGIGVGDIDSSGHPSLFVTNFQNEPKILFRNEGRLLFRDWSYPSRLGPATIHRLAFGTVLFDADLDGVLDVAIANGHVYRNSQEVFGHPFAQEAQLFLGEGKARFRDVSSLAGPYFRRKVVGRGLAWGDYDNDGLPDLVFSHNGGPATLLRNATRTNNGWLRLELVGDGKKSNRNAIGARVEVESAIGKSTHFVIGGGSYLSASDRRLLIGLGSAAKADRVTVSWPSGHKQEFRDLKARTTWRLHERRALPEEVTFRRPP